MTTSCPVCGFDPNPPEVRLSDAELAKQRLRNIFMSHAQQSWWLSQADYICGWLKDLGFNPSTILDLGCGDGRFVPAISSTFPGAKYTGIDRLDDHIVVNTERMPDIEWVCGEFADMPAGERYDMVLIMGTLNPLMDEARQEAMLRRLVAMGPKTVVCQFDRKSTGVPPDRWLAEQYDKTNAEDLPREFQSPRQDNALWVYGARIPT